MKRFLSIILCMLMVFSNSAFATSVDFAAAESYAEQTEQQNEAVAAQYGYLAAPSLSYNSEYGRLLSAVSTGEDAEMDLFPLYVLKEYTFDADAEGWTGGTCENGALKVTGTEFLSPTDWSFNTANAKYIVFTYKNTSAQAGMTLYYNETQTKALTMQTEMAEYGRLDINLTELNEWNGGSMKFEVSASAENPLYIDKVIISSAPPADDYFNFSLGVSGPISIVGETQHTFKPIVSTNIADAATTVSYMTNNNNVEVTKNADGSVTLTGRINGETALTVIPDYDPTQKKTVTVNVTGIENTKIAFYDINVFMIGNSILSHGPHADWPQGPKEGEANFGMAATAPENDYAHRLTQYYMGQKYGEAKFKTTGAASFEKMPLSTDPTNKDYTSQAQFKDIINQLKDLNKANPPEIITIQMGENANGLPSAQYENAVGQLIDGLKAEAPNAEIIVCTPFWPYEAQIVGMKNAAKKKGVRIAYLHELGGIRENEAHDTAPGACETHPSDLGMDRIASRIYEQVNIALTGNGNIKPTYVTSPTGIEINSDGGDTITAANGTLQMKVSEVFPVKDGNDAVEWSVDNENIATIDENGLVTAVNNGTVTVTAVSRIDNTVTDTYTITISGQTPCYTVTYSAGTDDGVTNLPANFTYAKGEYALSTSAPKRQYYIFNGWSLTEGGKTVKTVDIKQDTTVYASWRQAKNWEFDIDGYNEGITTKAGFNVWAKNGVFQALATDLNVNNPETVLQIISPELNINSAEVNKFVITVQNTLKADDTKFKLIVKTTENPDGVEFEKNVTTTDFTTYEFDLTSLTGTITGFTLVPTNIDCGVNIDQMGFAGQGNKTVTYDANTTDTVTGMPPVSVALSENYSVSSVQPKRNGYTLVGWSESADSMLPVHRITVTKDTTLYAIWDINAHWDFSLDSELGNDKVYREAKADYSEIVDGKIHYNNASVSSIHINASMKIDALQYKTIEWRLKNSVAGTTVFYWSTGTPNSFNGNSAKYFATAKAEDYTVFTTDLDMKNATTENTYWTGTVVDLRIDPKLAGGEYWLDYVRFPELDSESIFVIKEGMVEKASEIPYSNVIVDGGTLVVDTDWEVANLAISGGNVDLTNGTIKVTGKFESAQDAPYVAAAMPAHTDGDYSVVSGDNRIFTNAAAGNYVVKLSGDSVYVMTNTSAGNSLYCYTHAGSQVLSNNNVTDKTLVTKDETQIRTTGNPGIRFMADVANSVRALADGNSDFGTLKEIGFIAARGDVFTGNSIPTFKDVESGKAVSGVAYGKGVDKIFATGADYTTISCVLYNVPMNKTALETPLKMVPYVTINNGTSDETVYGKFVQNSLYQVAAAIKEQGGDAYTQNKDYIDQIIATCTHN